MAKKDDKIEDAEVTENAPTPEPPAGAASDATRNPEPPIKDAPTSTRTGIKSDSQAHEMVKNKLVIEGLRKAQILLSYGAENGIPIDKQDIEVFTIFKEAVQDGTWTPQEEADFWEAYTHIAKALGDVKAKEIEAITISDKPNTWLEKVLKIRSSEAQRVANSYTLTALLFVILMLIVQVYSLIGNNLVYSANKIHDHIKELEKERSEIWGAINQNGGNIPFLFADIIKAEDAEAQTDQNQAVKEAKFKLKEVNFQLWQHHMKLLTIVFNIEDWLITKRPKEIKELQTFYTEKDSIQLKYGFYKEALYMNPEESFAEHEDTIQMIVNAAKSPLDVMNLYILPLLYGLIGAFAFVLRSFTSQLEAIDYSRDSNIKFLLRIFLGALVGLTVRMFFDSNNTSGLAMYSPLAISFISGYSVEFFFSMVDNLIKRILGSDPQANKQQDLAREV